MFHLHSLSDSLPESNRWFYELCDLLPSKLGRSLVGIYTGNVKYFVITGVLALKVQIELQTHDSLLYLPEI